MYELLNIPSILARVWPVWSTGKEKNQISSVRTLRNIFVTNTPRASFWPSLREFHFSLFPGQVDNHAKPLLSHVNAQWYWPFRFSHHGSGMYRFSSDCFLAICHGCGVTGEQSVLLVLSKMNGTHMWDRCSGTESHCV